MEKAAIKSKLNFAFTSTTDLMETQGRLLNLLSPSDDKLSWYSFMKHKDKFAKLDATSRKYLFGHGNPKILMPTVLLA